MLINKELLLKVKNSSEIKRIKKSKYFDEDYYLRQNADVRNSGMDAASHYFYYGWKENRNPSENFNTTKLLLEHPEIYKSVKNPILYVIDHHLEDELKSKIPVDILTSSYFRESQPLKTLPIESQNPRINVVYNGFDRGCFFGGKATALILAVKFAQKYNYELRIISQNPERQIFNEFLELFDIDYSGEVTFHSIESGKYLEIGKNDHFICTMWTNADSVINTKTITGKVFYIMQEVETFFYDHGDYHLRCFNTLTDNSLIPIVNTKLLYDYFSSHGYSNVKNNGIYFEPAFPDKLLSPSSQSFKKKKKYKLFFYARPSHQRNLFYFGLDILNKAFLHGVLDPREWEVYFAGDERMSDFEFNSKVKTKALGVMKWKDYCDFASTIDLCYSLIYTPHPSYPPFDFVKSGAVVMTNKYANKKDLFKYSKNIICAELNEKDMLDKFPEAIELVKDTIRREKNFKDSKINESWDESFKEVLPFMYDKIEGNKNV
jgi:hypothetical protein